eukprot:3873678-Pleurochrysis_carterae.AAC.3
MGGSRERSGMAVCAKLLSLSLLLEPSLAFTAGSVIAPSYVRRSCCLIAADTSAEGQENVLNMVARSRQRSYEDGRRGCCYKANDYLQSTTVQPQPSEASPNERRPLLMLEDVTLATYIACSAGGSTELSEWSDRTAYAQGEDVINPPPTEKSYCKYDAIRESLKESRLRRSTSPSAVGSYLDSTIGSST